MYYDTMMIDMGAAFDRPTALFLVNKISNVPEWNGQFMAAWQKNGIEEVAALYRSEDAGPTELKGKENCGNYGNWIDSKLGIKRKGVAILLGQKQWCPVLHDGVMEIVVGEAEQINMLGIFLFDCNL